jgi:hypothetical protein
MKSKGIVKMKRILLVLAGLLVIPAFVQNGYSGDLAVEKIMKFPRVNISKANARIVIIENDSTGLWLGINSDKPILAWKDLCRWSLIFNRKLDSVGVYNDQCCSSEPVRENLNDSFAFKGLISVIKPCSLKLKCNKDSEADALYQCADSTLQKVSNPCIIFPNYPKKIIEVPKGSYSLTVTFDVDTIDAFIIKEIREIPDTLKKGTMFNLFKPDTLWYGSIQMKCTLISNKNGVVFKFK